jgi:hypothetical protein
MRTAALGSMQANTVIDKSEKLKSKNLKSESQEVSKVKVEKFEKYMSMSTSTAMSSIVP